MSWASAAITQVALLVGAVGLIAWAWNMYGRAEPLFIKVILIATVVVMVLGFFFYWIPLFKDILELRSLEKHIERLR